MNYQTDGDAVRRQDARTTDFEQVIEHNRRNIKEYTALIKTFMSVRV